MEEVNDCAGQVTEGAESSEPPHGSSPGRSETSSTSDLTEDDVEGEDAPGSHDSHPLLCRRIYGCDGPPGRRWVTCEWPPANAAVGSPKTWRWRLINLSTLLDLLDPWMPPEGCSIAPLHREFPANFEVTWESPRWSEDRRIEYENLHFYGRVPDGKAWELFARPMMTATFPF